MHLAEGSEQTWIFRYRTKSFPGASSPLLVPMGGVEVPLGGVPGTMELQNDLSPTIVMLLTV